MTVKTVREPKGRVGHVLRMLGRTQDIEVGVAGDIIAAAKLDFHIGETLFVDQGGMIECRKRPTPCFRLRSCPSRATRTNINGFAAFRKDRVSSRNAARAAAHHPHGRNQRSYLTRMNHHYKLEVETKPPRIPYRETIMGTARDIEYTHKKQTGGAGQYGKVVINVLPNERGAGYEFVDKIFGGAIDQAYRSGVDKGVRAQMAEGVLAGFPVVDVKVELTDGKTHPVDSKDIAFQIAGRGAFKDGFMKAKPVLLEPIVHIEVIVPADNVGDITGDLASRRGRPQGQEILPGGMAAIKAVVPLAEIDDYNSRLSSITGGQGS